MKNITLSVGDRTLEAVRVCTAERPGATTLYSEDLNDGQRYGSVTVVNPFREPTGA